MSDPTLNLRIGLTVGSMDPRFRAACEETLTAYDNLTAERDRLQAFIRKSALNKGVPASVVDAAMQEESDVIGHCAKCGIALHSGSEGECFTVCTSCWDAEREKRDE